MPQKLILNIMGEAPYPGAMCLNHGHGYYAYTNTMNSNLRFLLKKFCIWSNSTDTKELIDGSVYLQYELDCNCKDFVTSPMFKLICEQANTELIICDSYDNAQPLREFFDNVQNEVKYMTHMQKVVCIKSAAPRQEQFGTRGFMYYIDLNSLYGDSDGDWYADLYSLGFTKLGTIKINRFRSMTHTQTKENTR